jgi:phosphoglycolate phosphatase-like HAD superfamily hydrolase
MDRKILLLDLDDTLIDTTALRRDIFTLFEELGYDQEHIQAMYEKARASSEHYHPEIHARLLNSEEDEEAAAAFIVGWQRFLRRFERYVFPNTIPYLTSLDKQKYSPRICSWGNASFQALKVEQCGLQDFIEATYFPDKTKAAYLLENNILKPEDAFIFVDDSQEFRDDIQSNFPNALIASSLTEVRNLL